MQPRKNVDIHTTGACIGTHACTMTVEGRDGMMDTAGTMYMVPTGMGEGCTATVVAQWQLGTTKNEFMLWHMANLMTVQSLCLWVWVFVGG
jgi:hypothetical protein